MVILHADQENYWGWWWKRSRVDWILSWRTRKNAARETNKSVIVLYYFIFVLFLCSIRIISPIQRYHMRVCSYVSGYLSICMCLRELEITFVTRKYVWLHNLLTLIPFIGSQLQCSKSIALTYHLINYLRPETWLREWYTLIE